MFPGLAVKSGAPAPKTSSSVVGINTSGIHVSVSKAPSVKRSRAKNASLPRNSSYNSPVGSVLSSTE